MNLIDRSESLKNPATSDQTTYNPVIVEFAKQLETWVYTRESPRNLIFTNELPDRFGTPIAHLPQRPDYHEYDVLTHLLLSSWIIRNHWQDVASPFSMAINSELFATRDLFKRISEIAAYFHDLEKVVESRKPYTNEHIGDKGVGGLKIEILNALEFDELGIAKCEGKALKVALWDNLLMSDRNIFRIEILNKLSVAEKEIIKSMLHIYLKIDEAIIGIFNGMEVETAATRAAEKIIPYLQGENSSGLLVWSFVVMAADNYSQGLPQQIKNDRDEIQALEDTHLRNIYLMNQIYTKLFENCA